LEKNKIYVTNPYDNMVSVFDGEVTSLSSNIRLAALSISVGLLILLLSLLFFMIRKRGNLQLH
jgi:hypothetical protein